jgi:hypothetical protein
MTPQGDPLPFFSAPDPGDIAVGPDGNLWFTEYYQNKIGRITPSGTLTEFPIATPRPRPNTITTCGANLGCRAGSGSRISARRAVCRETNTTSPESMRAQAWPATCRTTAPIWNSDAACAADTGSSVVAAWRARRCNVLVHPICVCVRPAFHVPVDMMVRILDEAGVPPLGAPSTAEPD